MPTKQEHRRQIMIPPDLWTKVQVIAKADMTSGSDVVRTALREYVNRRIVEARARKAQPGPDPVAVAGGSSG
jgi:metal-responsive CopG/Arc/MetJ family transcriptional regulator